MTAIRSAKAPARFTQKFLEGLGFPSSNDRLIIAVLKALGLLSDGGEPTSRYFAFLDESESPRVMAEAVREAYGDLFEVNVKAHTLSRADVQNKIKTLAQGQYSDTVLDKMAMTFGGLCQLADFGAATTREPVSETRTPTATADQVGSTADEHRTKRPRVEPEATVRHPVGLTYSINIVLPESRDSAVYDALFRSLREHLPGLLT